MQVIGDATPTQGRQRIRRVDGELNLPLVQRYANMQSAIRRGLPQVRGHVPNAQRLCLVGSGPSLESTLPELRALAWAGCKLVAMNGSYEWLIAHNLKPSAMVVIDGRAFNARFLTEPVADCTYFLASQCAPETFDRVRDWPQVTLWHCLVGDDPAEKALLDDYYLGAWQPIAGGSTVGLRAIVLFRILGFQSFDLFGMDSCELDGRGHVASQPENDADGAETIYCAGRAFRCSAWHVSQALEFLQLIETNGEKFQLQVHGDGLLAHMVTVGASAAGDDLHAHASDAAHAATGAPV